MFPRLHKAALWTYSVAILFAWQYLIFGLFNNTVLSLSETVGRVTASILIALLVARFGARKAWAKGSGLRFFIISGLILSLLAGYGENMRIDDIRVAVISEKMDDKIVRNYTVPCIEESTRNISAAQIFNPKADDFATYYCSKMFRFGMQDKVIACTSRALEAGASSRDIKFVCGIHTLPSPNYYVVQGLNPWMDELQGKETLSPSDQALLKITWVL